MAIGVHIIREHHYEIKVDHGLLAQQNFKRFNASKKALVTDPLVRKLHGQKLEERLSPELVIEIPQGEKGKTQVQVERIRSTLAHEGFDRDSMIFTFGGGALGDTAGCAAARHLRGVRYVHIPTTLLAQVDSSIGGKVGVNTQEGKNMDGAFYQPTEVLSDTSLLETLPKKEWTNGLAEIVKYAIACDPQLFDLLEEYPDPQTWGKTFLANIIRRCVDIKKEIVEDDELETKGTREILNYGHTVGHALEKISGYKLPHGQAVGIGMVYEAQIASDLGLLNKKDYERIIALLKKTGLFGLYDDGETRLVYAMRSDKKRDEQIRIALPVEIGALAHDKKRYSIPVKEEAILNAVRKVN